MANETVAILVDNMFLDHVSTAFKTGRLDPRKFPEMLLRQGEIHYKTYIFDALPFLPPGATQAQRDRKEGKGKYLDALQYYERIEVEKGYVSRKDVICPDCGAEFITPSQKLVDVKISVRLVSLASETLVNKIVLVTGDGDIQPAVKAIERTGTIVRLAYAEVNGVYTNKGLIKCCPEKHKLTKEDLEKAKFVRE